MEKSSLLSISKWADSAKLSVLTKLTNSGQVYWGRCLLFSVSFVSLKVSVSCGQLYDGRITDRLILTLEAPSYCSDFRDFPVPLFFDKGIGVLLGRDTSEITLQWLPL